MMKAILKRLVSRPGIGQTLLETALFGLVFSSKLWFNQPLVWDMVTGEPVVLALACGLYAALRLETTAGSFFNKLLKESVYGFVYFSFLITLNGLIFLIIRPEGDLLYLWVVILLSASCSLIGYLFLRLGLYFWFFWQNICERKMTWALVYSQIKLVLIISLIVIGLVVAIGILDIVSQLVRYQAFWDINQLSHQMFNRVFPNSILVIGSLLVFTFLVVLFLLPLFGFSSYLFTRRFTRRLEKLALTADSFGQKNYQIRVPVEGKDEVARLQIRFNSMAGDLVKTMEELQTERDKVDQLLQGRQRLFAGVSHELRTPVSIIRSGLDSIKSNPKYTTDHSLLLDLETIGHQIISLQKQLDDLFLLSNAEMRNLSIHCIEVNLNEQLSRIIRQYSGYAWNSARVEVTYHEADEGLCVWVDPDRLEQVIINLLRNAVRFTSPGGVVMVHTLPTKEGVQIRVRDTGCGISPQDLQHIWEPYFHKSDYTDSHEINAGLGLPLVKELMDLLGGTVTVESQPGEGSCFTITLPGKKRSIKN